MAKPCDRLLSLQANNLQKPFQKGFAEILYVVKTQPDKKNSRFSIATILCNKMHASLEQDNPNTDITKSYIACNDSDT